MDPQTPLTPPSDDQGVAPADATNAGEVVMPTEAVTPVSSDAMPAEPVMPPSEPMTPPSEPVAPAEGEAPAPVDPIAPVL